MKVIKRKQQNQIQSDTCGLILEVINQKDFPFGIVLSENIKSTDAHYHKKAKKCYWMLEGWVNLKVENIKTGKISKILLDKGDLITFDPFEKHQIIDGSDKNRMVTITSPAWHIEDVVKE